MAALKRITKVGRAAATERIVKGIFGG